MLAVEEEGHLVKVGRQMLRADFVPASDNATLQERKGRFNSIGVDVGSGSHVFLSSVVNRLMFQVANRFSVGWEFVLAPGRGAGPRPGCRHRECPSLDTVPLSRFITRSRDRSLARSGLLWVISWAGPGNECY